MRHATAGSVQPCPGRNTVRARARISGCEIEADLYVNIAEVERRRELGVGALKNLDLLNLLLRMPLGKSAAGTSFSEYEWSLLRAARGAVSLTDDGFATRCAMPPVDPEMITVHGDPWRYVLRRASRFAPYSARRVVLRRMPDDDVELRMEAVVSGVGVAVATCMDDQGVVLDAREILPSAPFTPVRYTGASWLVAEELYDQSGLAPSLT